MTTIYTDGACSGNPGPGGWAWAEVGGPHASGFEPQTTNQRMEIMAAFEAVKDHPLGSLEIVSDSTYVVNCFRDRWWEGWQRRGWKNSAGKLVANRDLWEPFIALVRERGNVSFQWVKGHSGDVMNDLVDRLAVEAIAAGRGVTPGDVVDVGAVGDVEALDVTSRDKRLPPGHLLGVFGLRPTELGGYLPNPIEHGVRAKFDALLRAHDALHSDLAVVSGLRLGAELIGAEAAQAANLPLVGVLPYPNPESVWPRPSQERFQRVVATARSVITLERKIPASAQQAGAALRRRDAWLARNIDEAIVVWDGQDELVGRLVRTLEDRLGAEVSVINP